MISFATKNDLDDLKEIWQECFGDPKEYIDFFFSNHRIEEVTLVYRENEKPIGMLNLIPATLITTDGQVPIRYVYAVGTLIKYRGKGVAKELLKTANDLLMKEGIATVLVPATKRLYDYYKNQGYKTHFYLREQEVSHRDLQEQVELVESFELEGINLTEADVEFCDITADEYKSIRDVCFHTTGYVAWDIDEIKYALNENAFLGGESKKIIIGDDIYSIMYYTKESTLVVKETTIDAMFFSLVMQKLIKQLGCSDISLRTSAYRMNEGTSRPFGMIYGFEDSIVNEEAYLNLVLD